MRSAVRKCGAGLVRHGVDDAEQGIGEGHAGEALCVVHRIPRTHVLLVGGDEILLNELDRVDGEGVRKITVRRRDISLNRVCQRIHTGVGDQLLRHGLRKLRVDDGDIRSDFKVRDRILCSLFIVCDDGEGSDLRGSAGGGGDGAEAGLPPKLWKTEDLAHILKAAVGVFVADPHRLCRIDRRATAHRDDPVGAEALHRLCALHNRIYGRVGFDPLIELDLHTGFLQIRDGLVQEAEALHGASADKEHRPLSLELLQCLQSSFSMINIPR